MNANRFCLSSLSNVSPLFKTVKLKTTEVRRLFRKRGRSSGCSLQCRKNGTMCDTLKKFVFPAGLWIFWSDRTLSPFYDITLTPPPSPFSAWHINATKSHPAKSQWNKINSTKPKRKKRGEKRAAKKILVRGNSTFCYSPFFPPSFFFPEKLKPPLPAPLRQRSRFLPCLVKFNPKPKHFLVGKATFHAS